MMQTPSPSSRRRERDPRSDAPLTFFRSFLRHPREVGSIIPSSRFLERRVVRCADLAHARSVVELGPGTGGTTRALLAALRPDARLLSIEINPHLARVVQSRNPDPRLVVHVGSAEHLAEALMVHGFDAPDVVVSGIPFSTLPPRVALQILESVRESLAPDGRFVAYQVRDRVATLGRQIFGPPLREVEPRNVPPMRVYRFEKPVLAEA